MSNGKDKGDVLEKIIENLCSSYGSAKVTRNAVVKGKIGIDREIDVLIFAQYKSFDIKIIIEAKNYSRKVDVDKVEAFVTKLNDVGGNLGVMVCPLGFTEGAVRAAAMNDIQLYQVFDHALKNTTQFIPIRYIVPSMRSFQVNIKHQASGGSNFSLPTDLSLWRIHYKNEIMNPTDASVYAWNNVMFPQKAGIQSVDFGVVKISTKDDPKTFYYLELKMNVIVDEEYYLKLLPSSYMKNIASGKGNHFLNVDAYSKREDMIKNGWKSFPTREELEKAAQIYETSPDIRGMTMTEQYQLIDSNSN